MSVLTAARGRARLLVALVCAVLAVLAGCAAAAALDAPAADASTGARYAVDRPLCRDASAPFRCFAVARQPASSRTPGAYKVTAVGHGKAGGYSPADLAKAYGYNPDAAVNQTVAIVDWYDDPRVAADLAAFDRAYGLPAETSRSFRKVNQDGKAAPLPRPSTDAAPEIALDVQAVRAVCHKCRILLVEANSASSHNLATAENTAVRLGANEISNSFGGPESSVSPEMVAAFRHPGVVITAANGDDGWYGWDYANDDTGWPDGEASFPATDPYVVAVGGTRLSVNTDGSRKSETVWNANGADDAAGLQSAKALGATGGGCSRRFAAGSWQWHVLAYAENRCGAAGHNRVAADVAAVGDPETGFDVRETYGYTGWITIGGTSLSSPLIAAMFALAGGSGGSAYPAASLYVNSARQPGARYDVTQGGNGFCGGETDLQRCMTVTAAMPLSANNNPNALYDEPIDCSFSAGGQAVTTAPAPGRQCNAQPGYDGPTGLGTPIGLGLFRATSATGALVGPATPRLHRAQRWSSTLRPRLSGASITSYSWSWGDGTQSRTTAASAAHTYTRAGHYKVTLSATDALSQVVVRTRTIRVGQAPSVHYSGPQRLAAGRRGTFSAAGTHAVNTGAHLSTVTWSWGDGHRTHLTSTRRVTHRYAHTGRYRVTLTVRDSTGVSRSVRHTVRVS